MPIGLNKIKQAKKVTEGLDDFYRFYFPIQGMPPKQRYISPIDLFLWPNQSRDKMLRENHLLSHSKISTFEEIRYLNFLLIPKFCPDLNGQLASLKNLKTFAMLFPGSQMKVSSATLDNASCKIIPNIGSSCKLYILDKAKPGGT